MSANEKQVGGNHYASGIQHWDYVIANELDYFQAQVTKYVTRWKKKNGIQDLEKAMHFLEKYIESEKMKYQTKGTWTTVGTTTTGLGGKINADFPFGYNPKIEGTDH